MEPVEFSRIVDLGKDHSLPYRRNVKKNTIHWGQRKLLIGEIEFLTRYWDPVKYPTPVVLYVGAASGEHLIILGKLFPTIRWILIDPAKFCDYLSAESENVQIDPIGEPPSYDKRFIIYHCLFPKGEVQEMQEIAGEGRKMTTRTIELPDFRALRDARGLYFVCDIRRGYNSEDPIEKIEKIVYADMMIQKKWVEDLQPTASFLKFRPPYNEEINTGLKFEYFKGTIYRQVWEDLTSTECRIVPDTPLQTVPYDFAKFESIMFYFNIITRDKVIFPLNLTRESEGELLNDYDSYAEYFVISEYLKKIGVESARIHTLAPVFSRMFTQQILEYTSHKKYSLSYRRSHPREFFTKKAKK